METTPQYPIGGYAQGNYKCICLTCKTQFLGDKLACQCEPCAVRVRKENIDRKIGFAKLRAIQKVKECIFGKEKPPKIFYDYDYFMSTSFDKATGIYTYWLMRMPKDRKSNSEIVFAKPVINQEEFKTEVANLSKYFNAHVIEL